MRFNLAADSEICINTLSTLLAGVIESQVSRLNFDGDQLVMRGTFTPRDTDGDLSIDQLDNGQWTGVIDGELDLRVASPHVVG